MTTIPQIHHYNIDRSTIDDLRQIPASSIVVSASGVGIPEAYEGLLFHAKMRYIKHAGYCAYPLNALDNTAKLRLAGFNVPWIVEKYPFPGPYQPYQHQRASFHSMMAALLGASRFFNLSGLGSGKTLVTSWAIDALLSMGFIKTVIIFCTKSIIHLPWANTLFSVMPQRLITVIDQQTKPKKITALESAASVVVVNHHGASVLDAELAARTFDMVIIDEATVIKTVKSAIHKDIFAVASRAKYVVQMTATPTANNPLDAHGQLRMAQIPSVPNSVTGFKSLVSFPTGTAFGIEFLPDAEQTIHKLMWPNVCFVTSDCIDLPPEIRIFREVGMTREQEKAYKTLIKDFVVEISQQRKPNEILRINAVNALALMAKLLQISCGVVWGEDENGKRTEIYLPNDTKEQDLLRLIESSESKVVVFAPYVPALQYLLTFLRKKYGDNAVELIIGKTPSSKRSEIISTFQDPTSELKILVAHPITVGHGVTLTAASLLVWYGCIMRTEIYLQGCGRLNRPGQEATRVVMAHLIASAREMEVYESQHKKISNQRLLLDMFNAVTKAENIPVALAGELPDDAFDTLYSEDGNHG